MATFSADLIDLKPGDFVVHSEHGVAQYLGLREISAGENQGDYMLLEYANEAQKRPAGFRSFRLGERHRPQ